jgi:hypothetical protein
MEADKITENNVLEREILNNAVPLEKMPGLKLKNIIGFEDFQIYAENGIFTKGGFVGKDNPGYEPATLKDFLKKEKLAREAAKSGGGPGYGHATSDSFYDEGRGNVFYPEGMLQHLMNFLRVSVGLSIVELPDEYYSTAYHEFKYRGINSLLEALELVSWKTESQKTFFRLCDSFDSYDRSSGKNLEIVEQLQTMLSDENILREIQEWFRSAFLEYAYLHKPSRRYAAIIDGQFAPDVGLVFDQDTEVHLSYNDDYRTQAKFQDTRVKPHKIRGIYVNRGYYEKSERGVMSRKLNHEFNIKIFKQDILTSYTNRSVVQSFMYWYSKKYSVDIAKVETDRRQFSEAKRKNVTIPSEQDFTGAVDLFLEEHPPLIKDGQTYWDYLVEVAKKLKVPIYNLDGKIIWPRN